MSTTNTARAFDPTTDPFDPREEGWGGWTDEGGQWQCAGKAAVIPGPTLTGIAVHGPGFEEVYDHFKPHASVVKTLLSLGYTPEVE